MLNPLGANNITLEVVDNDNPSDGGLGTVVGTYHITDTFSYNRNTTMDPIHSFGTTKVKRIRGMDNNTFSVGVTPAYDTTSPKQSFSDSLGKINQLLGKTNLSVYINLYQNDKADKPDRDTYRLGSYIFNGCSVSGQSGGFNAGNTQSSITLSGEFEEMLVDAA